jgi:hypothetical protein
MNDDKELWLKSLTHPERLIFFINLNHGMTIAMRVISKLDDPIWRERVESLTEAHHAVSSHLVRAAKGGDDHHWLPLVIKSVFLTKDAVLKQQIEQAWQYAKKSITPAA